MSAAVAAPTIADSRPGAQRVQPKRHDRGHAAEERDAEAVGCRSKCATGRPRRGTDSRERAGRGRREMRRREEVVRVQQALFEDRSDEDEHEQPPAGRRTAAHKHERDQEGPRQIELLLDGE